MYLSVLTIVLGWSAILASLLLLLYFVGLAILFHLRLVWFEERWLSVQFGSEWERYSKAVHRWIPIIRTKRATPLN